MTDGNFRHGVSIGRFNPYDFVAMINYVGLLKDLVVLLVGKSRLAVVDRND